jgi:hypothetical protein
MPEATTMIAGALLLLPLGASTLRMLRKLGFQILLHQSGRSTRPA